MITYDAKDYMPSLVKSEYKIIRVTEFKKHLGMYYTGQEDIKFIEYSGYVLAFASLPHLNEEGLYYINYDNAVSARKKIY